LANSFLKVRNLAEIRKSVLGDVSTERVLDYNGTPKPGLFREAGEPWKKMRLLAGLGGNPGSALLQPIMNSFDGVLSPDDADGNLVEPGRNGTDSFPTSSSMSLVRFRQACLPGSHFDVPLVRFSVPL
jgi:hypothetical protein